MQLDGKHSSLQCCVASSAQWQSSWLMLSDGKGNKVIEPSVFGRNLQVSPVRREMPSVLCDAINIVAEFMVNAAR
jgi:hypothetical protein